MQPAPAFQHHGFRVVVSRIVNLEETLGAAFVVHHGTVAFRKACRGEHQVRFVHNRGALMINHHHQRRFRQRSVDARGGSMTVQVVFQHDNRICGTAFQFVQRLFKRAAADHAQANAVHRAGDHSHAHIGAAAFQRFRHVGGSLNDFHAAGVSAGDNQRFFRPGQRLNDHINFTLQVMAQAINRRRAVVQRMGDSKAQTRLIFHRRAVGPRRDVIEAGVIDVGDE